MASRTRQRLEKQAFADLAIGGYQGYTRSRDAGVDTGRGMLHGMGGGVLGGTAGALGGMALGSRAATIAGGLGGGYLGGRHFAKRYVKKELKKKKEKAMLKDYKKLKKKARRNTKKASFLKIANDISLGAYGEHAQAALKGIEEAQALAYNINNEKVASDPWGEASPLYNSGKDARIHRLNTLLRRH